MWYFADPKWYQGDNSISVTGKRVRPLHGMTLVDLTVSVGHTDPCGQELYVVIERMRALSICLPWLLVM